VTYFISGYAKADIYSNKVKPIITETKSGLCHGSDKSLYLLIKPKLSVPPLQRSDGLGGTDGKINLDTQQLQTGLTAEGKY